MKKHTVVLALAVAVSGCGGRGIDASSGQSEELRTTISTVTTVAPVQTTAPLLTTSVESSRDTSTTTPAESTTVPVSTTRVASDTSTLLAPATELPEPFGTVEELIQRSGIFAFEPRDAKIESYLGFYGDPDVLAEEGIEPGPAGGILTLTYYGDMTVWDFGDGYREVSRGDESYVFSDGEWAPNDRWEWPPMGPFYEWDYVQTSVERCVEVGAELIGVELVAGVETVHLRCTGPDNVDDGSAPDLWVAAEGQVMRLYAEGWEEPGVTIVTSWDVIAVDVPPDPPLPPGW